MSYFSSLFSFSVSCSVRSVFVLHCFSFFVQLNDKHNKYNNLNYSFLSRWLFSYYFFFFYIYIIVFTMSKFLLFLCRCLCVCICVLFYIYIYILFVIHFIWFEFVVFYSIYCYIYVYVMQHFFDLKLDKYNDGESGYVGQSINDVCMIECLPPMKSINDFEVTHIYFMRFLCDD